ncbi:PDZ domain-containing protein [Aeromicrobium sp. UC242_57]|uniref:PDZ domain-containing protein n=1 Tax=Aeromicrobium sp. UC242_57 TaxID=3374624 RepID=UPI003788BE9B
MPSRSPRRSPSSTRSRPGRPPPTCRSATGATSASSLSSQVTGAYVAGVVSGSAAQSAGLTTGSTVTSLNGISIVSADALSAAVAGLGEGDRVTVAWTDSSGQAHTETVTLGDGPVG